MQDPEGREHTVRIEWVGNRLRRAPSDLRRRVRDQRRRAGRGGEGAAEGCLNLGDLEAWIVIAAVVAALALVWFVVIPAAWGLLEVLVIVLVAAGIWAFRVLFRRPWTVAHRTDDELVDSVAVVGWRRAHAVMVEAAEELGRTGGATAIFSAQAPFS